MKQRLVSILVATLLAPALDSAQATDSLINAATKTLGSAFDGKGVSIDANMLASLLKGDETLVLNPGSKSPLDIQARELKALMDAERLPK